MLIESHRHTPADLELWKQHEVTDLMLSVSRHRLIQAIESIEDWDGDYVSCSWGKDSVVMLHLVAMSRRRWPVVWMRFGDRDNPDCERVRDAFLARYQMDYHERFFDYNKVRAKGLHWKDLAKEFGPRRMLGLRAHESSKRMISVASQGLATANTCRPLAWWSTQEVFTYLATNQLPVHPAYAMLGGGRWERHHLRTHSLGGSSGSGMGRSEWEREYYGDVLNKLEATP